MTTRRSLQGLKILVTRPGLRGEALSNLVGSRGGETIQFPVIEIVEPDSYSSLDESLQQLGDTDLIMFVSVSAVDGFIRRIQALDLTLPGGMKVAAVGHKTAERCAFSGIKVDFVPGQRMDSEGMLECLSGLSVKGRTIVIYRGQSGRELLKTGLEIRGAKVKYVNCYQRQITTQSIQPVVEKWRQGKINMVLISSVAVLDGLIELLGEADMGLFQGTTVATYSARIADQCTKAGIADVLVSDTAGDAGILELLATKTYQ